MGADSIEGVELTELVAEPEAGRVFEQRIMPGIVDANGGGRVRLDAIARWLQNVAYLDLIDAGFDGRGAWIVRRTRIRVEAFPRFGEEVVLRTFCSGIGRFSAERSTTVRGESAHVDTVALWVCLDPDRGRPMRFPADFIAAFSKSAGGRDANVRLRHPDPPVDSERQRWSFRATEIDQARHVNNSHYWIPVEEELALGPDPDSIDAEVEYRDPAEAGEAELLRSGGATWVASPSGELHASILVAR